MRDGVRGGLCREDFPLSNGMMDCEFEGWIPEGSILANERMTQLTSGAKAQLLGAICTARLTPCRFKSCDSIILQARNPFQSHLIAILPC